MAGESSSKRKAEPQSSSSRKTTKTKKDKKGDDIIKPDIWLRLPHELLLEVFRFIVADNGNHHHDKCLTHCTQTTMSSKLALKERYEKGGEISESSFIDIAKDLYCPIWGLTHLDQLNVVFMIHHCECSLPSELHQFLRNPGKLTIGQLTLTDGGKRRYRKDMYAVKVVIKDFGVKKKGSIQAQQAQQIDQDSDDDEDDCVKVCYHDGLREVFKDTCGKVATCKGGLDRYLGTRDLEHYLEREAQEPRICDNCAEQYSHEHAIYEAEMEEEREMRRQNREWGIRRKDW